MSEKKIRKPVSAFMDEGALSVVCDDGTSWYWRGEKKEWIAWVDPIPGTVAALSAIRAAIEAEKDATR